MSQNTVAVSFFRRNHNISKIIVFFVIVVGLCLSLYPSLSRNFGGGSSDDIVVYIWKAKLASISDINNEAALLDVGKQLLAVDGSAQVKDLRKLEYYQTVVRYSFVWERIVSFLNELGFDWVVAYKTTGVVLSVLFLTLLTLIFVELFGWPVTATYFILFLGILYFPFTANTAKGTLNVLFLFGILLILKLRDRAIFWIFFIILILGFCHPLGWPYSGMLCILYFLILSPYASKWHCTGLFICVILALLFFVYPFVATHLFNIDVWCYKDIYSAENYGYLVSIKNNILSFYNDHLCFTADKFGGVLFFILMLFVGLFSIITQNNYRAMALVSICIAIQLVSLFYPQARNTPNLLAGRLWRYFVSYILIAVFANGIYFLISNLKTFAWQSIKEWVLKSDRITFFKLQYQKLIFGAVSLSLLGFIGIMGGAYTYLYFVNGYFYKGIDSYSPKFSKEQVHYLNSLALKKDIIAYNDPTLMRFYWIYGATKIRTVLLPVLSSDTLAEKNNWKNHYKYAVVLSPIVKLGNQYDGRLRLFPNIDTTVTFEKPIRTDDVRLLLGGTSQVKLLMKDHTNNTKKEYTINGIKDAGTWVKLSGISNQYIDGITLKGTGGWRLPDMVFARDSGFLAGIKIGPNQSTIWPWGKNVTISFPKKQEFAADKINFGTNLLGKSIDKKYDILNDQDCSLLLAINAI